MTADTAWTVIAVGLWTTAVVRWRAVIGPGPDRSLWSALVALAVMATVSSTDVRRAITGVTGTPTTAATVKHLAFYVTACAVVVLVESFYPRAGLRRWLPHRTAITLAAAGALLVALPAFVPPTGGTVLSGVDVYDPAWWSVLAWGAYAVELTVGLTAAARTAWANSRPPAEGPLRTGLVLIGVGALAGFSYVGLKLVLLAAVLAHRNATRLDQPLELVTIACAVIPIGIGSSFVLLAAAATRVRGTLTDARDLHRLRPLWRAIRRGVPGVTIRTFPVWQSVQKSHLLLLRTVVEIYDGLLELRPFAAPSVVDHHRVDLGPTVDGDDATREARWIQVALVEKGRGAAPGVPRPQEYPGHGDLRGDLRWLCAVSRAFQHLPAPRAGDQPTGAS